jgi:phospholipase C
VVAAGAALAAMASAPATAATKPILHVVVLFQENASFDHYFGTYPHALNKAGETGFTGQAVAAFTADPNTPTVNGLTPNLLTQNPNVDANGKQANPFRLAPSQAYTCSHNHSYTPEQSDVDGGLQDKFPQNNLNQGEGCDPAGGTVMAYFDGNTVTAYWNYAQHYALSDNFYGTDFGPSTPGAIDLVSGNTYGGEIPSGNSSGSMYVPTSLTTPTSTELNDIDPYLDDCGADAGGTVTTAATLLMTEKNIGDLLNAKGVSWGWFQGGFAPTTPATLNGNGSTKTPAKCANSHTKHEVLISATTYVVPNPTINPGADIHTAATDYVPHHEPFMYYASTRNPHHLRPTAGIGSSDQANHQYDTNDFFSALSKGNLPSVSFIKAPAYQDGHPGNSDPLTEQAWIVQTINKIEASSFWPSTAIIVAYDDSDGWYDHVVPSNVRHSAISTVDVLSGTGRCGTVPTGSAQGRCGFGPRLPMLVISPYSKSNYVDHALTDQTSITAFIETNWNLGYLDGTTAPTYGTGSADRYAGSIMGMFDFTDPPNTTPLVLDPVTGAIVSGG